MLIRFQARNYRSLREGQELSCVASGALRDHRASLLQTQSMLGADLLPVLAIYGANASGKSNVLRALRFMGRAVEYSQRAWDPNEPIAVQPFALDSEALSAPSQFEAELLIDNVRYQYGFLLNSRQVLGEWLYAYPQGRRQVWFVRDYETAAGFRFGKSLLGEKSAIQSLTRPNSLFLSAAAQNNHDQLTPIYNWFASELRFVEPDSRSALLQYTARLCEMPAVKRMLLSMLGGADLGLVGIDFSEQDPSEEYKRAVEVARQVLSTTGQTGPTGPISESLPVDLPKIPVVALRHLASTDPLGVALPFEEESNGTQALFGLLGPILSTVARGAVLCVDELDASLHPLMGLELLRIFADRKRNTKNAQLIFTTHDTHLLNSSMLRRDQIWFTEKDSSGSTHLYPLSDFEPRRHENLERGYLQGRYGAIPFVDDAAFDTEEKEAATANA